MFTNLLTGLAVVIYAAAALVIGAAIFFDTGTGYVAMPVPTQAFAAVDNGLALLIGLPLP